jgi:putative ABC transport system permease protein
MIRGTPRWGLGMAGLLAWRNLTHDRARFFVTLVGIVFAVVLIGLQIGLFLGFAESATCVIRKARANFWVMAKGTQNFDVAQPISEREIYLARSVPGVDHAEPLIVRFANWKKPNGGIESSMVLGADLNTGLIGPWNIVAGRLEDLRRPESIMIDRIFADKLDVREVGDTLEINDLRQRVVGFTQGIRSFTTFPWVFASLPNARRLVDIDAGQTSYIIGTFAPGANPDTVKAALRHSLPRVDVYSSAEFAIRTLNYWMFTTGAGTSVLVAAVLGLLVGMVIVAQVLYATTVDHLAEFGTLRAMGAPRTFIYQVILGQAVISATLGYLPGIGVSLLIAKASESSAAVILVPSWLAIGLFGITLAMCILASIVSIRKAIAIDPAMVFQR